MDLTHSLPSILSNILTDYLPPSGFQHAPSPALDYAQLPQREKQTELLDKLKAEAESDEIKDQNNPELSSIGPFGESVPATNGEELHRVQFYADNIALKLPLVSPIFDRKHLRGLPPLLVVNFLQQDIYKKTNFINLQQCGSAERLRDESIYSSLLASNTYPGSTHDTTKPPPTQVTLEVFEDQPHVFQLLFSNKTTSRAFKNLAAFVRDMTNSPAVYHNTKKQEKTNYLSDNPICIRHVNPQGEMIDTTKDTLDTFTKSQWVEWNARLNRSSIKERMDDVNRAVGDALKNVK